MGTFETNAPIIFQTINIHTMQDQSESQPQFGKYDLIAELSKCFPNDNSSTIVGIGDDASVIDTDGNQTVSSTKVFIEDVHFDLTYVPLKHLGYKVITVAVTDILGMNAIPTQVTVNVAVSNRFDLKAVNELRDGAAMREFGRKFAALDEERQGIIKELVPQQISEAEPKDVGKRRR